MGPAWQALIGMVPGADGEAEIVSALLAALAEAGFPWVRLIDLPLDLQPGVLDGLFADTWPHALRETYAAGRQGPSDPVIMAAWHEPSAYFWSDAVLRHAQVPEHVAVAADRAAAGLADGVALPFHSGRAWRSLALLACRDGLRPPPSAVAQARLAVLHAGDCLAALRLARIGGATAAPARLLSPREHEALRWIALGKTAWEASLILEVAKTTVDRHLANARRKLGARTNAHAVALAMPSGLPLEP